MTTHIHPDAGPAKGPPAATLLEWAKANADVHAIGALTNSAEIKAALEPLLAQMSADFPIGNLRASTAHGTRCLTYLASVIAAIDLG